MKTTGKLTTTGIKTQPKTTKQGENTEQPKILPTNVVTERTIEEFYTEIGSLMKAKELMENSLKQKVYEIRKIQTDLNYEKEITQRLNETIQNLEKEKSNLQVNFGASRSENEKLTEELKIAQALIIEKERYIEVLVKNNSGRLNIEEQFKYFDPPKRDFKRSSLAQTWTKKSSAN